MELLAVDVGRAKLGAPGGIWFGNRWTPRNEVGRWLFIGMGSGARLALHQVLDCAFSRSLGRPYFITLGCAFVGELQEVFCHAVQLVGGGSLTSIVIGEGWEMGSIRGSVGSFCFPSGFSDGIIILLSVRFHLFMLSLSEAGILRTSFVSAEQLRCFDPRVGVVSFGWWEVLTIGLLGLHICFIIEPCMRLVCVGNACSFADSVGSSIVVSERDILCKVIG